MSKTGTSLKTFERLFRLWKDRLDALEKLCSDEGLKDLIDANLTEARDIYSKIVDEVVEPPEDIFRKRGWLGNEVIGTKEEIVDGITLIGGKSDGETIVLPRRSRGPIPVFDYREERYVQASKDVAVLEQLYLERQDPSYWIGVDAGRRWFE